MLYLKSEGKFISAKCLSKKVWTWMHLMCRTVLAETPLDWRQQHLCGVHTAGLLPERYNKIFLYAFVTECRKQQLDTRETFYPYLLCLAEKYQKNRQSTSRDQRNIKVSKHPLSCLKIWAIALIFNHTSSAFVTISPESYQVIIAVLGSVREWPKWWNQTLSADPTLMVLYFMYF